MRVNKNLKKISRFVIYPIVGLLVCFLFLFINLPNVSYLREHHLEKTSFMKIYESDRDENDPPLRHTWVDYSRISPQLKVAILVAEDDTFFDHEGFNWEMMEKAMKRNWEDKKFTRGGSTLTQQLVKNLYLSPSKNPFRKLREMIIAFQMEHTLEKQRIFELYLNYAEWGEGIYGAEAASRHYFQKSAASLSASEAAFLAAILPGPKLYSQPKYKRYVNRRTQMILGRMQRYIR